MERHLTAIKGFLDDDRSDMALDHMHNSFLRDKLSTGGNLEGNDNTIIDALKASLKLCHKKGLPNLSQEDVRFPSHLLMYCYGGPVYDKKTEDGNEHADRWISTICASMVEVSLDEFAMALWLLTREQADQLIHPLLKTVRVGFAQARYSAVCDLRYRLLRCQSQKWIPKEGRQFCELLSGTNKLARHGILGLVCWKGIYCKLKMLLQAQNVVVE